MKENKTSLGQLQDIMSAIWRAFVGYTTVHGFRHAFESPSRFCRVIWSLLLLGATGCYIYFAQQSVSLYFSNPVTTDFTEVIPERGELTFPAVTICNLNRFVKSKINMFENDGDFYELGLNLSACEKVKLVNKDMSCGQGLLCAFEDFGSEIADNCNETTRQRLINALNETKEPIFNLEEFFQTYGHNFNDMFFHYCRFMNKENCTQSDFRPSLSENGLCFTFNSGKNETDVRSTRRAGSLGGLSLMMDVQANENTISEFSRGLRVMVHDQKVFINTEKGLNVFPGSHTVVRMAAKKYQRLPSPYKSNCTQRALPQIPRYTRDGCLFQCLANRTAEMCGCRMIGIPVPLNLPVCTFQHQFCVEQSSASNNPFTCNCGVACEEIEYTTQVSYSEFPDDGVGKILKHLFAYNKSMEYQRRNLVFLQVSFQHQGYLLQKETPSYNLGSLLGDLGGNMGLFLGCSLLTLFEFVDLLWNLLESRANRVKSKSPNNSDSGVV